jgi:hypothetical protein
LERTNNLIRTAVDLNLDGDEPAKPVPKDNVHTIRRRKQIFQLPELKAGLSQYSRGVGGDKPL